MTNSYTINWERVARAETHQIRIEILEGLAADGGRSFSPAQFARETSRDVRGLSYHFKELLANDLIEVADTRPVRGALETFYRLQALVACRAGLGRVRLRRFQSPYYCDYHLEPECDVYGVGYGTLSELQRWGYLQESKEEGPLSLTPKGDRVLDEILELEGSSLPPLVMEAAAA